MIERPEDIHNLSGLSQIDQVIQPPKTVRTEGILNLIFFTVIFFGFGFLITLGECAQSRVRLWLLAGGCWLLTAAISIWGILVWKYVSITFQRGKLILQGVFTRREMKLSEIEVVRWKPGAHSQIQIRTANTIGTINLHNYDKEDQLWLIHCFHAHFPEHYQENWPLFCLKIALPLKTGDHKTPVPPNSDAFLHTRRRWDRLIIIMTLITALTGILTAWHLQEPKYLLLPLFPLCCWFVRYTVPREGVSIPLNEHQDFTGLSRFLALWSVAWVMIYLLFRLALIPTPGNLGAGWPITVIWIAGLYGKFFQFERRQHQRDMEKAKTAVQEWDAGSAELAPHNQEGAAS
ncbi:hypothetical protein Enr10x_37780 [Gimesia panareensis]|uniref:Uncharacterized protein n=2 Tax=Gimesia panareensis TaxID=2527978 RepID=A0A517Q9Y2_9PLAN|nr:hypothetical protein Enr10x_37780 [Gimesia panareensis]